MYLTHITQYFEKTVAQYPDRVAVYDGDTAVTFRQLYARVIQGAWQLSVLLGGKTGRIVAVCLPKSVDAVVADLAILYSGNAYMGGMRPVWLQWAMNACAMAQL